MEYKMDNFERQFKNSFFELFKLQKNCDVAFIIEGRILRAHRMVISFYSESLKVIFDQNFKPAPVNIAFFNYRYTHLEAIIRFMYTGVIRFQENEINDLIKCAKDLKVSAILEYLEGVKLKNKGDSILTNGIDNVNSSKTVNKRKADEIINKDIENKKAKNIEIIKESDELTVIDDETNGKSTVIYPPSKEDTSNKSNSTNFSTKLTSNEKPSSSAPTKSQTTSSSASVKPQNKAKDGEKVKKQGPYTSTPINENIEQVKKPSFGNKEIKKEDQTSNKQKNQTEQSKTNNQPVMDIKENILPKKEVDLKGPEKITCKDCGKVYLSNIMHKKLSLYPQSSSGNCPFSSDCKKVIKFRRALIDHLIKFHKLDVCEEK